MRRPAGDFPGEKVASKRVCRRVSGLYSEYSNHQFVDVFVVRIRVQKALLSPPCHRPVTAASPRTRSMHRRTSCHRGVTGPSPLCHRTPIKWIRRARCHRPVTTPSPLCHRARACGFGTRSVTAASPRCHQYVTTHFRSWKYFCPSIHFCG